MLRGDISGWRTILARIYFGEGYTVAFSREEDFVFVMNVIAQAAALYSEVQIIAFEVMNNHFHFVVSADEKPGSLTL